MSHLLDACVYQDFSRTGNNQLLEKILPSPCYTSPRQIDNPREISSTFCTSQNIVVPPGVSAQDLLCAYNDLRLGANGWDLSDADLTIGAYAVVTGFVLLTGDGALRRAVQAHRVKVQNSLDLLETGLSNQSCTAQEICGALRHMLSKRPPRRGIPQQRALSLLTRLGC